MSRRAPRPPADSWRPADLTAPQCLIASKRFQIAEQVEAALPSVVDRKRLRGLVDDGALLVEVLPANEYQEDHIPERSTFPCKGSRKRLDASSTSAAP